MPTRVECIFLCVRVMLRSQASPNLHWVCMCRTLTGPPSKSAFIDLASSHLLGSASKAFYFQNLERCRTTWRIEPPRIQPCRPQWPSAVRFQRTFPVSAGLTSKLSPCNQWSRIGLKSHRSTARLLRFYQSCPPPFPLVESINEQAPHTLMSAASLISSTASFFSSSALFSISSPALPRLSTTS